MAKGSDNPFPSLLFTEGTEPSAPAAGKQRLYVDSTSHRLKRTDSAGAEKDVEAAALVTTKGDLLVASASGALARLAVGATDGHVLTVDAASTNGLKYAAAAGGGGSSSTPWLVQVNPVTGVPATKTGTWTPTVDAGCIGCGYYLNDGTVNTCVAAWDLEIAAGTWAIDVMHFTASNRGIMTWAIDDGAGSFTTVGTIDSYDAGGARNIIASITGITVTGAATVRRVRLTVSTKNAGSGTYYMTLQSFQLRRTA